MSAQPTAASIARGSARHASRGSWKRRRNLKPHKSEEAVAVSGSSSRRGQQTHKQRPTHFLSLPLGRHRELQNKVQSFTDSLLGSDPPITGLEKSIIIEPARLHITLGVMHLLDSQLTPTVPSEDKVASDQGDKPTPKTVNAALTLLQSLQPQILKEIGTSEDKKDITIPLDKMGFFTADKHGNANVLWVGPAHSATPTILDKVSKLVNNAFRKEGFITEKRPLKLHCTVLNTTKRKGRRQIPFSQTELVSSEAYKALVVDQGTAPESSQKRNQEYSVDFGVWSVDEIQLCEMGSRDPMTGAYASVGSIKF